MSDNPPTVSDHAVLRWLERAHGLDVEACRRRLSGLAVNAARLGAVGVTIDGVKLVLRNNNVTTVLKGNWHSRDDNNG